MIHCELSPAYAGLDCLTWPLRRMKANRTSPMQRTPRCGLCSMLAVTGAGPLLRNVRRTRYEDNLRLSFSVHGSGLS